MPNIYWTQRTTPLGLGIPWPPCWQFGTILNHALTWRPCHSQNRRSWATPKRYVGRIWLDTNPMAHSGPSRACASFAPTMSVRNFGQFEQFSTFSARRAPCSATSSTPDSWINGPYMTWVLWTLVPMVHTPRGRGGVTFVKVLAQGECGRFCHFGICGPNWDRHQAEWHEDL